MHWQNPTYLWAEILPGLLLLSWIVSEVMRARRLKVFGDPRVLGVSVPWVPRIAALVMLLLGVGFAAAVIPLPVGNEVNRTAGAPVIQLLVDIHSLEGAEDQTWEAFDAAIPVLVERFPGARYSATALGSPAEVLVYPTEDWQGLQIILARLRFGFPSGSRADLAQALAKYEVSRRGQNGNVRSIVITALPADEVERAADSMSAGQVDFFFARVSGGLPQIRYFHRNPAGNWVWTAHVTDLQQLLRAEAPVTGRKAWLSPAQWFALLAVIFLCAEYICALSAGSRTGRMKVA